MSTAASIVRVRKSAWLTILATASLFATPPARADDPADEDDGKFGLTKPIACKEIRGYEDYEPLLPVELTSEDKLLVYYRPMHFKSEKTGKTYEARLSQDGRIRRKGEKSPLYSKKYLDYRPTKQGEPPSLLYIRNTVGLKGLKPGEYEFDIILKDEVSQSAPAVRSIPFKVIPTPPPPDEREDDVKKPRPKPGADEPESPGEAGGPKPARRAKKPRR
jgi:hypothetical protein